MYQKAEQPYAKNNRSLLSPSRVLDDDTGLILILGHGNSRTVYIERIKKEEVEEVGEVEEKEEVVKEVIERMLTSYSISFADSEDSDAPDVNGQWIRKFLPNSKATADEARDLKRDSHTRKEYLVKTSDLQKFLNVLHTATLEETAFGEKDQDINDALESINIKKITFRQGQSQCCVLS